MQPDLKTKIDELIKNFADFKNLIDLPQKKLKLKEIEAETLDPDLWKDQEKAKTVLREFSDLKKEIEEIEDLEEEINLLKELTQEEVTEEFAEEVSKAQKTLERLNLTSFLSGAHDNKNALVSIHAGQGGTEAMDWVSMLLRMYLRFAERRGWSTAIIDSTAGEEAGIKSVTFKVDGPYAYGYLKGEVGTHRLVRQSPFNADNLRQTSFALVEVLPELEDADLPGIEIKEEDLDWQFSRSSSKGGQNVQKVSTAVRLIHKPTGIAVTAQTERFQEQNRKIALNLLRGKLWVRSQEELSQTKKTLKGEYRPASWGNQIRSYVLHPYKMIKDLRTEVETGNTEAVLDGEIDAFIEAELKFLKEKKP
jgi:peptide chain release factor 2